MNRLVLHGLSVLCLASALLAGPAQLANVPNGPNRALVNISVRQKPLPHGTSFNITCTTLGVDIAVLKTHQMSLLFTPVHHGQPGEYVVVKINETRGLNQFVWNRATIEPSGSVPQNIHNGLGAPSGGVHRDHTSFTFDLEALNASAFGSYRCQYRYFDLKHGHTDKAVSNSVRVIDASAPTTTTPRPSPVEKPSVTLDVNPAKPKVGGPFYPTCTIQHVTISSLMFHSVELIFTADADGGTDHLASIEEKQYDDNKWNQTVTRVNVPSVLRLNGGKVQPTHNIFVFDLVANNYEASGHYKCLYKYLNYDANSWNGPKTVNSSAIHVGFESNLPTTPKPPAPSTTPKPKKKAKNLTWLWILLGVLGACCLAGIVYGVIINRHRF